MSDLEGRLGMLAHPYIYARSATDPALGVELAASGQIAEGSILGLLSGRFVVGHALEPTQS